MAVGDVAELVLFERDGPDGAPLLAERILGAGSRDYARALAARADGSRSTGRAWIVRVRVEAVESPGGECPACGRGEVAK